MANEGELLEHSTNSLNTCKLGRFQEVITTTFCGKTFCCISHIRNNILPRFVTFIKALRESPSIGGGSDG